MHHLRPYSRSYKSLFIFWVSFIAAIDLSHMMLTGAVTQEICDQLAGPILQQLAVDCGGDGDGNGPKVTCDCCDLCTV
jgi:hypothetical protein